MVERSADQRIRTTEWEDIQYKHGNRVGAYATNELGILAQNIADKNVNTCLTAYNPHEERVQAKLERGGYENNENDNVNNNESGNDDDDDEALAAFRRRRVAELQRQQEAQRFGVLRHVPGADYEAEVTEASAAHWVVAALIRPAHGDCERLLAVMRTVAQRRRDVKFVSMIATEAVKNFPDCHLPCVLLYNARKLQRQLTELAPWMADGRRLSLESVERVLHRCGVIRDEELDALAEEEEEAEEEERGKAKNKSI